MSSPAPRLDDQDPGPPKVRRISKPAPGPTAPPGESQGPASPRRLEPGPPAPVIILPVEAVNVEHLGIGEMLDLCEALGVEMEGLAALMRGGGVMRARALVGFAWILARRTEPAITWAEAQRWRIEVEAGRPPDPTPGPEPQSAGPSGSPG